MFVQLEMKCRNMAGKQRINRYFLAFAQFECLNVNLCLENASIEWHTTRYYQFHDEAVRWTVSFWNKINQLFAIIIGFKHPVCVCMPTFDIVQSSSFSNFTLNLYLIDSDLSSYMSSSSLLFQHAKNLSFEFKKNFLHWHIGKVQQPNDYPLFITLGFMENFDFD